MSAAPPLPHPTLAALCLEQGRAQGDRIALRLGTATLSYAALAREATSFAHTLRTQGVVPGDRVLLMLDNSFEYVVALFGILLAGAVAVPLSPETANDRLRAVCTQAEPAALVLARATEERKALASEPGLPTRIMLERSFEENCRLWQSDADTQPLPVREPGELAMLIFTSGTTGQPKGVMLTHRNLMANTASIVAYLDLKADERVMNILPFYYSYGHSVLATHLAVGGEVIIENRFMYPQAVVRAMQQLRPTGFSGVPATFYILLERTSFEREDWSFLRTVTQAGGGMRREATERLRRAMPQTRLFVMYGQTEATARLSYLPPHELERKLGTVGMAIPGVTLRVVDEQGAELPRGTIGEIAAAGENVMQGYYRDPDTTARTLREGWLHTGDMGHMDDEGYLTIVSRKSDFIKTGSYRVSPGEIEEVIARVEGVEDVAAIGIENALLGEVILACVAGEAGRFDPEAIRRACLDRLPFYMVPRHIVHELQIPRTGSGKLQYNVLRERYRDYATQQGTADGDAG